MLGVAEIFERGKVSATHLDVGYTMNVRYEPSGRPGVGATDNARGLEGECV